MLSYSMAKRLRVDFRSNRFEQVTCRFGKRLEQLIYSKYLSKWLGRVQFLTMNLMMSSPRMEKPDTGCYFFNYGPGGQNKALEEV